MLEKLVGKRLETIGENALNRSYFLKDINLKNAKQIGSSAFYRTSLKIIKNKHIQALKNYQFSELIADVEKVKMKSLKELSTLAFAGCTVQLVL